MARPVPFGKYALLERINVGGMAEIFKAMASGVEGFEKLVAIKRILPNIAENDEFIEMFIDEAKIAVQLSHANIVHIFDLGNVDDSYFIAMEYVHGRDLRAVFERLRKRGERIPIPLVCHAIIKTCEGLEYAHSKRDARGRELHIVHRDISPQNLLLSFEGDVKIIDFGIAKAQGKASKSHAGILKGKFGYMSPEQARGLPLDHRSDIFGVGVILYEMLAAERLFTGENDFSTLEKIKNAEVRPLRELNPDVPPELERIALKTLARDVEDRYQHCSEMMDDLKRFVFDASMSFTSRDLSQYMRTLYADDLEREDQRRQQDFDAKGLVPPPLPPGGKARQADAVNALPKSSDPEGDELGRSELDQALDRALNEIGAEEVADGDLVKDDPIPVAGPEVSVEKVQKPKSGSVQAASESEDKGFMAGKRRLAILAGALGLLVVLAVFLFSVFSGGKPAVVGQATLSVNAKPGDAEVLVDGVLAGHISPVMIRDIAVGSHEITARRDGYDTQRVVINIKPGEKIDKSFVLEERVKSYGSLRVESDPPGAVITIDGNSPQMQATPVVVEKLPAGVDHDIAVDKDGMRQASVKVRVGEGETKTIRLVLAPLKGKLSISSSPSGAAVSVNGEPRGKTPVDVPDLDTAKKHAVRIEKQGFAPYEEEVAFDSGGTKNVSASLEKAESVGARDKPKVDRKKTEQPVAQIQPRETGDFGYLSVIAKPWAHVYVDGKDSGNDTPLYMHKIPAGPHSITLKTDDGRERIHRVIIDRGSTTRINENFN